MVEFKKWNSENQCRNYANMTITEIRREAWQESAKQEREKIVGMVCERLRELLGLNSSTAEIKRMELLKLADRIDQV